MRRWCGLRCWREPRRWCGSRRRRGPAGSRRASPRAGEAGSPGAARPPAGHERRCRSPSARFRAAAPARGSARPPAGRRSRPGRKPVAPRPREPPRRPSPVVPRPSRAPAGPPCCGAGPRARTAGAGRPARAGSRPACRPLRWPSPPPSGAGQRRGLCVSSDRPPRPPLFPRLATPPRAVTVSQVGAPSGMRHGAAPRCRVITGTRASRWWWCGAAPRVESAGPLITARATPPSSAIGRAAGRAGRAPVMIGGVWGIGYEASSR